GSPVGQLDAVFDGADGAAERLDAVRQALAGEQAKALRQLPPDARRHLLRVRRTVQLQVEELRPALGPDRAGRPETDARLGMEPLRVWNGQLCAAERAQQGGH